LKHAVVCDISLHAVVKQRLKGITGKVLNYLIQFLLTMVLYCAGGKIEKNEMGGHVERMGEGRGVHRVLVRKPEGKTPLGRPIRRWEDNIKMDLREVGGCGDWMELAQDKDRWGALVNTVMNFRVP